MESRKTVMVVYSAVPLLLHRVEEGKGQVAEAGEDESDGERERTSRVVGRWMGMGWWA